MKLWQQVQTLDVSEGVSDSKERRMHSSHSFKHQPPHLLAIVAAVVGVLLAVVVIAVSVLRRVDAGTKGILVQRHRLVLVLVMCGVSESGSKQAGSLVKVQIDPDHFI